MFETSLYAWLFQAYYNLFGEQDSSTIEKVIDIGIQIFELNEQENNDLDSILVRIDVELGGGILEILQSSEVNAIEGLLLCAVSHECRLREDFVEIILNMDKECQVDLMEAIKSNMDNYRISNSLILTESKRRDEDNIVDECEPSSSCSHCTSKQNSITELQQQLQTQVQKLEDLETQMKFEISKENGKLIDAELVIIEKDRLIVTKDNEIREAYEKMSLHEVMMRNLEDIRLKNASLEDELEISKFKAEKLDLCEDQILRLREKLDELQCVKQQLQLESESHSKTYSQLIEAEAELVNLRKYRSQIDDYRGKNTELMILQDELENKVKESDYTIKVLTQRCESLVESKDEKQHENHQLITELQASNEFARMNNRVNGIGEGISELNPVLMQELTKLRSENMELKSMIQSSSVDALNEFERKLEDEKSLNTSLQSKYYETKKSLNNAISEIERLQSSVNHLEYTSFEYKKAEEEAWKANENFIKTLVRDNEKLLLRYELHRNDSMYLLKRGNVAVVNELELLFMTTCTDLTVTKADLNDRRNDITNLNTNLLQVSEKLNIVCERSENDRIEAIDNITTIQQQTEDKIQNLKHEMEVQIRDIQEQHDDAMNAERERFRNLQMDMDEEKLKRRRVEREKKIIEAEAHRLKSQNQSGIGGSGSSNEDMEATIKELRAMQQELDHVRSELLLARSRPVSALQGKRGTDAIGNNGSGENSNGQCNDENQYHAMSEGGLGPGFGFGFGHTIQSRPQRLRGPDSKEASGGSSGSHNASNNINTGTSRGVAASSQQGGGGPYVNYLEAAEMNDKKVEQLSRDKRELLTKSLEANKERTELSQKVLLHEKEISQLKSKVTKLTLEKERLERKFAKEVTDVEHLESGFGLQNHSNNTNTRIKRLRSEGFTL